jgi:hypothetical protein
MQAFGRKPTQAAIESQLRATPLEPPNGKGLQLLYTVYERKLKQLGKSTERTTEICIDLFEKFLRQAYPTLHGELREEYINDLRSRNTMASFADQEGLDPVTYRRAIECMKHRTSLRTNTPKPLGPTTDTISATSPKDHTRPTAHYAPALGMAVHL